MVVRRLSNGCQNGVRGCLLGRSMKALSEDCQKVVKMGGAVV